MAANLVLIAFLCGRISFLPFYLYSHYQEYKCQTCRVETDSVVCHTGWVQRW